MGDEDIQREQRGSTRESMNDEGVNYSSILALLIAYSTGVALLPHEPTPAKKGSGASKPEAKGSASTSAPSAAPKVALYGSSRFRAVADSSSRSRSRPRRPHRRSPPWPIGNCGPSRALCGLSWTRWRRKR